MNGWERSRSQQRRAGCYSRRIASQCLVCRVRQSTIGDRSITGRRGSEEHNALRNVGQKSANRKSQTMKHAVRGRRIYVIKRYELISGYLRKDLRPVIKESVRPLLHFFKDHLFPFC